MVVLQAQEIERVLWRSTTVSHLRQVHSLLLKSCLLRHPFLVSVFISCASSISLPYAHFFFRALPATPPLFTFNLLIRAFSQTTPFHSLTLFRHLHQTPPFSPDNFTFPPLLTACGRASSLPLGGSIHSLILKMGFTCDPYINNTLFKMYADCGALRLARKVFDEMPVRDVVSWSSMISTCVSRGFPCHAMAAFFQMGMENVKPNSVTLVSLLSACTKMLNLGAGASIHSYIVRNQVELDVGLGTALFEMYAKCGQIDKALQVFDSMHEKNLQSCTIMISALANHGRQKDAISLFSRMEDMGLQPDSLSFSAILSACGHMGLVSEGKMYFDRMVRMYSIKPTVEHYGCMVDLLGRAGLIEEAHDMIKNMPMEPNAVILRSFLGACRNLGWVPSLDGKLLSKLESELGANYVLTASIFSTCSSWKDANDLRLAMKHRGLKKTPGCSWVEVQN
ncbi:hypothetical protein S245_046492 [Arachis hypogaea]